MRSRIWRWGVISLGSLLLLGSLTVWRSKMATAERPHRLNGQPVVAQRTPTVNPKVVAANTQFGFKLFAQLQQAEAGKNLFVSPASVAIALGMVANGATGETQRAIETALSLQGISLAELNQANRDLKALLQNPDPKVQLAIANSLWANQAVAFKPEFLRRNQEFYDAKVTNLNFADPKAAGTINNWVAEKTRGKIQAIVDQVRPDDLLFLINAIYFKGNWSTQFDKKLTVEKPFFLANGTQKKHPLMSQTGEYRYYETDQFQAVSLPYGETRRMSLYVFLPKSSNTLSKFSQTLTADTWQQWMTHFRSRPGAVQMPRFKLEYKTDLKRSLSALGMGIAFDPLRANFSGISEVPARIDQVKHKTFVDVNEEGTEAAAVTSIGIRATSAIIDEPFQMVVNRPFFCAIRDDRTGMILFMGAIVDPKS